MKIVLIGDYPPPQGGIAVHVQQLHRFLRSQNVTTQVLDIGKGARPDPAVIPVRTWASYARNLASFTLKGWLAHLHITGDNFKSWLAVASVIGARVPWGLPPVVTLHSGLLPDYLASSRIRQFWARALLGRVGRVIVVSERLKDSLAKAGVGLDRIAVHPAFLGSQLKPGRAPAAFLRFRSRCTPMFAMADHPSSLYGRALMLRALGLIAQKYPKAGLALFGPGARSSQVAAEAHRALVEDRVLDLAELDHPSALAVMSRCDAFVRPTTVDGDSLSVREALALGIRCVASDVVPRPAGTWLFRSGDASELAKQACAAIVAPLPQGERPDGGPALLSIYQEIFASRWWRGARQRRLDRGSGGPDPLLEDGVRQAGGE
jgi:glycosyltransferase involved in cell wall biosynthesis